MVFVRLSIDYLYLFDIAIWLFYKEFGLLSFENLSILF